MDVPETRYVVELRHARHGWQELLRSADSDAAETLRARLLAAGVTAPVRLRAVAVPRPPGADRRHAAG